MSDSTETPAEVLGVNLVAVLLLLQEKGIATEQEIAKAVARSRSLFDQFSAAARDARRAAMTPLQRWIDDLLQSRKDSAT